MASINSGNHHHHHHSNPTYHEDSGNFNCWDNNNPDDNHDPINQEKPISKSSRKLVRKPKQRTIPVAGKSLPVNTPDWSKILRDSDGEDDGSDEWLPPHEYLARIRGASPSVHEGVGRTLKGRDLSRLRNAIWKQTGFELD